MRQFRKLFAVLLTLALIAGVTTGAWAETTSSATESAPLNLAERFVDYDLSSKELIRVIVEFEGAPLAEYQHKLASEGKVMTAAAQDDYVSTLESQQEHLLNIMKKQGLGISTRRHYTTVYNGVALEIPANQVEKLARMPGVKSVHPDVEVWADTDVSVPAIGANIAWAMPPGLDGKGVLVAVLDTGADYMHPALGGGIGPTFKVIGGWDFVDDDDDPMEQKNMPGTAPNGNAWNTSHGTHVASTVAAVAPGAKLFIIRVLGPGGSGSSADVMAGIELAVRVGAHVANMSLGAAYGHPDSPWAKAVDNAVLAGTVFCVSNGNNGPSERSSGTYANTKYGISVGNADASPKPLVTPTGADKPFIGAMLSLSPALGTVAGQEYEFVDCGLGAVAGDFKDAEGNSKVTGKIALVQRGAVAFAVKSRLARDHGAVACIIYNNAAGNFAGTMGTAQADDIPTLSLSLEDGNALKALAEKKITLTMGSYNLMAPGSSRGPTPMLDIKPDVSAPGTNITAAYPYPGTDGSHVPGAWQKEPGAGNPWYGTIGGTSMAAPHVAGAAAILLQANPDWTPEQVKLALMNTAVDIKQTDGRSFRPIDQGAGMINVARALKAKLQLNPGALNFREVAAGELKQSLTVSSTSNDNAVYNVKVEKYNSAHAYEVLIPSKVTVPAGKSMELPVTLYVDAALPPSNPGASEYCGYIVFQNVADPEDYYRIPYHFVNKQAISQVTCTPEYFSPNGDGVLDKVTISFTVGLPVNDVRFSVAAGGFHNFFGYTGPLQPGTYSFEWDATVISERYIPDGFHTIHANYQLVKDGAWTSSYNASNVGSIAFARVTIDRLPPDFYNVVAVIDKQQPNHVTVRGNVDDIMLGILMQEGGWVWVNDVEQYVYSQNSGYGFDWGAFESAPIGLDLNTVTAVNLKAADKAGNVTEESMAITGLTVSNSPVIHTKESTIDISGYVVPGMTLKINGEDVSYGYNGAFDATVPLVDGYNSIIVEASVPEWGNAFTPIVKVVEVYKTDAAMKLITTTEELVVGETFDVSVVVEEIADMYGVEFTIAFDPTQLQVVDADPSAEGIQIGTGLALEGLGTVTYAVNSVDNTLGIIRFSAALNGVEAGFSGSESVASIKFRAVAEGTLVASFTQASMANSKILPIPFLLEPIVSVEASTGGVSGKVVLPGRQVMISGVPQPRYADVKVTVNGQTVITNDQGQYAISGLSAGEHSITAAVQGYLAQSKQFTISSENKYVVVDFELISGDLNGDNKIDIFDLVIVCGSYGSVKGSSTWDVRADINLDGVIDIFDLVAVTKNFGK